LYQKLAMGGSAGLPPVTMQTEGQDTQSFGDDESTGMPQCNTNNAKSNANETTNDGS
jgi:hypothetical protein